MTTTTTPTFKIDWIDDPVALDEFITQVGETVGNTYKNNKTNAEVDYSIFYGGSHQTVPPEILSVLQSVHNKMFPLEKEPVFPLKTSEQVHDFVVFLTVKRAISQLDEVTKTLVEHPSLVKHWLTFEPWNVEECSDVISTISSYVGIVMNIPILATRLAQEENYEKKGQEFQLVLRDRMYSDIMSHLGNVFQSSYENEEYFHDKSIENIIRFLKLQSDEDILRYFAGFKKVKKVELVIDKRQMAITEGWLYRQERSWFSTYWKRSYFKFDGYNIFALHYYSRPPNPIPPHNKEETDETYKLRKVTATREEVKLSQGTISLMSTQLETPQIKSYNRNNENINFNYEFHLKLSNKPKPVVLVAETKDDFENWKSTLSYLSNSLNEARKELTKNKEQEDQFDEIKQRNRDMKTRKRIEEIGQIEELFRNAEIPLKTAILFQRQGFTSKRSFLKGTKDDFVACGLNSYDARKLYDFLQLDTNSRQEVLYALSGVD